MDHAEPIAVQHAKDLARPARDWLQQLFGRPLRDDEDVTILLSTPHHAPSGTDRQAAVQNLNRVLDRAQTNLQDVPDAEFNDAVDDAMKHVRPAYEP